MSSLQVNGQNKQYIVLHDLFIDLARHLADIQQRLMDKVAKRVLLSYVAEQNEQTIEQVFGSETVGPSSASGKKKKYIISLAKRLFRRKEKKELDNAVSREKKGANVARKFHGSWISVQDDGFALRNLFHLLHIANMNEEGIELLSDPRWITKQMNLCDWKEVDSEFAQVLAHIEDIGSSEKR